MGRNKVHIAIPMIGYSSSDLQVGMYLNNDGTGNIPLYDSSDGTGTPILQIGPGETIGQIVDFKNGPGGVVVIFTSPAISSAVPTSEQLLSYAIGWLPGDWTVCASVNYSDIVANVSQDEITQSQQALATATAQGATFANEVKELGTTAAQAFTGFFSQIWPWALAGFGLYVLSKSSFGGGKGYSFSGRGTTRRRSSPKKKSNAKYSLVTVNK